jgi:hypothetical protein
MKVTKWSTFTGDFNVTDQNTEQTSGGPGSVDAGPAVAHSSDAQSQPMAASAQRSATEAAGIGAPDPVPGATAEIESKADDVILISASDHKGDSDRPELASEPDHGTFGKRRALAAVVALATVAGVLGGAVMSAGLSHFAWSLRNDNRALEASVARIEADLQALTAGVERTSKLGLTQFNRTSDRLDKLEKAQADPAAKIAKLGDAVEKLRATAAATPALATTGPALPKETTGSIAPMTATSIAPPKTELARLPTVDGWVLRDVGHGGALIESRRGVYEVYAGDAVPGLGRVDAVRRQDGRWVVVTTKGLVVAR